MKEFNSEKFCKDLVSLRGKESQDVFAKRLDIKRPTLSLLENGKQVPTIDLLSKICSLTGASADDYFVESTTDALVYLMGSLEESDKLKIEEMAERIRIKEKYEMLAREVVMSSIDNNELFEKYYQTEYDFNTTSLSLDEIDVIKKLAREKRVDYAFAPMGIGVFDLIQKQSSDIRFELVSFESDKIDGMLYIPTTGKERAYIILNSNKPLVNQVFAAAHEFYHYIKDYQVFKEKPYICDFSMLKDVNEKKACRFAAEILFPEEALNREVRDYCRSLQVTDFKSLNFNQIASFIIVMTVKYQMPLKAVIYRLEEEHFIEDVKKYIENYGFIKKVLQEIQIFSEPVSMLYGTVNNFIIPYSKTYQDMETSFITGNASKEDIVKDAKILSLDMDIINELVEQDEIPDDEEEADEELFSIINAKRG